MFVWCFIRHQRKNKKLTTTSIAILLLRMDSCDCVCVCWLQCLIEKWLMRCVNESWKSVTASWSSVPTRCSVPTVQPSYVSSICASFASLDFPTPPSKSCRVRPSACFRRCQTTAEPGVRRPVMTWRWLLAAALGHVGYCQWAARRQPACQADIGSTCLSSHTHCYTTARRTPVDTVHWSLHQSATVRRLRWNSTCHTGWVYVSIRKKINASPLVNTFSKNKYWVNRQHELMI